MLQMVPRRCRMARRDESSNQVQISINHLEWTTTITVSWLPQSISSISTDHRRTIAVSYITSQRWLQFSFGIRNQINALEQIRHELGSINIEIVMLRSDGRFQRLKVTVLPDCESRWGTNPLITTKKSSGSSIHFADLTEPILHKSGNGGEVK